MLIVDTTYFWRGYGIIVFRSHELKSNLLWKIVSRETKQAYLEGVKELQEKWWKIRAIVCDGKRGMLWGFWDIPTQMCHFHQKQIIRRYITKNPRLEANKELKEIVNSLWDFSRKTIITWLEDWFVRNKSFLYERNSSNKLIHNRTLQAYRSMKRNLPYLYTFKDYEEKFEIPRTTNSLESAFWWMKQSVRVHRWLKKWRKLKVIEQNLWK